MSDVKANITAVGAYLRRLRQERKLSITETAAALKTTKVTIIPITVHMPWWGFIITLIVVFLIMDVIVTRVLQRMRG